MAKAGQRVNLEIATREHGTQDGGEGGEREREREIHWRNNLPPLIWDLNCKSVGGQMKRSSLMSISRDIRGQPPFKSYLSGWRGDTVVQLAACRGLEFSPQYPHVGSQPKSSKGSDALA